MQSKALRIRSQLHSRQAFKMKKDLQKAKKLCEEACDEVYMKYDADLSYDHYGGGCCR